jgi:hypothetical protein
MKLLERNKDALLDSLAKRPLRKLCATWRKTGMAACLTPRCQGRKLEVKQGSPIANSMAEPRCGWCDILLVSLCSRTSANSGVSREEMLHCTILVSPTSLSAVATNNLIHSQQTIQQHASRAGGTRHFAFVTPRCT